MIKGLGLSAFFLGLGRLVEEYALKAPEYLPKALVAGMWRVYTQRILRRVLWDSFLRFCVFLWNSGGDCIGSCA